MDTTYIKMCDCEEIQEGHKWEYGDWLIAEYGLFQIGTATFDYDMSNKNIPPIRSELPIATIQNRDIEAQTFTGRLIWLPRQDQLQEMIGDFDKCQDLMHDYLSSRIGASITNLWLSPPLSMEQLWLAFVMKEKYNKVWSSEGWNATKQS